MNYVELIGMMAGTLTTICFIPQVIKVIKTNDTKSISLWMYISFSVGISLWLVYGLLISSLPIIIANAVTLPLALVILWKKIKNCKGD